MNLIAPGVVLSASTHRSGSTWVQRVLTASTPYTIWGESFDLIDHLSQVRTQLSEAHMATSKERHEFFGNERDPTVWVGNMNPEPRNLDDGLRSLIAHYYSDTPSYGWKEVRYGIEHLQFLRRLFPSLKFVLLVRNPYDVVLSHYRMGWLDGKPNWRLANICKRWADRGQEYLDFAAQDDQTKLVRYEDFRGGAKETSEWLGGGWNNRAQTALDAVVVGGPEDKPQALFKYQEMTISSMCARTMRVLGYEERELV